MTQIKATSPVLTKKAQSKRCKGKSGERCNSSMYRKAPEKIAVRNYCSIFVSVHNRVNNCNKVPLILEIFSPYLLCGALL